MSWEDRSLLTASRKKRASFCREANYKMRQLKPTVALASVILGSTNIKSGMRPVQSTTREILQRREIVMM